MMLTWLADVLRVAGVPVREVANWQTRGHGAMGDVLGVLCHHTAGPAVGLYPSENIVVNGRSDLAGPLANLGLDRAGTWIVIAAGSAWHAGTGTAPWCPTDQGNTHLIGVEAESTGRGDWTPAQIDSYPRGCAALLSYLRLGPERAIGHKEWAPLRKIDPVGIDMPGFRADVARCMSAPPARLPEDNVSSILITVAGDGSFHEADGVEAGAGSQIGSRAFLAVGCEWGRADWRLTALGGTGPLRQWGCTTPNNTSQSYELPPGTRAVTVEGRTAGNTPGVDVRPWARTYMLPV